MSVNTNYGHVDKISHPLKHNYLFKQLPLLEPLFSPGISSLLCFCSVNCLV